MSKIADALRKIQDGNSAGQSVSPSQHRKIGRIEKNGADTGGLGNDTADTPELSEGHSRIVQIDKDAMREAGLVAPEEENKLFEDEYRVIKRPILTNAFGSGADTTHRGYVVLVTSALAGDGKTFTCINLALSLAREQDTSVLLVDADVRKPHVSTLFDVEGEAGLLDYLDGSRSDVEDMEIGTSVAGLSILPTGQSRDNATELLSSSRMSDLLDSIHRRDPRRIVLLDSSPLLQTTEARALAAASGQIVVVVRAGITPKSAVQDSVSALDEDKPINLILNQVRFGRSASYYSSYYGGGYGSAYGGTDVPKE